jgi:GT2 family glycosyltransferase/Flp pilus assembly protein TadD
VTQRYLFGPVTAEFAQQNLRALRQAGTCLAFGHAEGTDLTIAPNDTWESLSASLPAGWQPDFIALWLPYTGVPSWVWSAPLPIIGLAADWNLQWHRYRRQLRQCEVVLTDTVGVENLAREGITQAGAANLYGCEPVFLDAPCPEGGRDLDVLFVGNLHPPVQRERLAWLGRLARLGDRWRVAIHTGVFDDDYRRLLARARIVFNRGIRGECNRRAFEATALGALLFQEAENREVPNYFRDRQECIYYTDDTLEPLLEHYLTHENERRSIAEAGRARVQSYSFQALWESAVAGLEQDWASQETAARNRKPLAGVNGLLARTWEALSRGDGADVSLPADLTGALADHPRSADLHNALGLAVTLVAQGRGPTTGALAEKAVGHFRAAVQHDSDHAVAGLNLVEALVGIGQASEAVEQARRTLAILDRVAENQPRWLDAGHFPPSFDLFRVEWERAAWVNAGRPAAEAEAKRTLVRWRLHALLADLTSDLVHFHEAALARSDLPMTRAALGCALGRAKRPADALPHLRQAVTDNPFDLKAARALFLAWGESKDGDAQRRLARDRRRLAQAAPKAVPAEPWFEDAAPVGDELASIIILCCNQLDYTRLCLESVLQHSRPPYELILVDNGSTDDTAQYLEEVRARAGPARVEVIHNEKNVGFPAGCNQGLAKASGRYVVFLNNDTVLTEGWLQGLIRWALQDWPKVGMVGAVTNYSRPPQQIPVDYSGLEGLDAFAARRRQECPGQALRVQRLTGFCLLARREALEQIGGFDEQFGVGFFDDDDLSVRALKAGFQLLVALNVFVHHFGSRTFTGLGIDCTKQLKENFDLFHAKWGTEESAGYRLPALPSPNHVNGDGAASEIGPALCPTIAAAPSANGHHPRISLSMIVKNEEANLPDCLASAADLVDEIVIVDTGSTDRTKEVAARFSARIFDFPWCDDFSAARNESLNHTSGEWVFWLDADDRLDEDNRRKLRNLFGNLNGESAAYVMKCICLPDQQTGTITAVDHIRLFRNHPAIRWQHRVHEQILAAVRKAGSEVRFTDVAVHHTGYCDGALRRKKLERDLRLLNLEKAERPDDPFTLFNFGAIYQELGRHTEAIPLLRRSLERSEPSDSITHKLYALIAGCHRALGQVPEAIAVCQEGLKRFPDDIELLFVQGVLLRERGELAPAAASLERVLTVQPPKQFGSMDAGVRGYKARHNLAVVYHQQGRAAEAEAQWRPAVAERPDFLPSWIGLGELYLSSGRWKEFEEVVQHLDAHPGAGFEGEVMRARGHMARREFGPALGLLRRVTSQHPNAVWPRVILSHALLQEGKDLAAAEQALRDVLTLDPGHSEARHNLSLVLRNQNRPPDDQVAAGRSLADLYNAACSTPSDIHEHLPKLYELASQCRHVTELGTRAGTSTTALLFAQPQQLVCYDKIKHPHVDLLRALAGRTLFHFRLADVLAVEIDETDLLFIDTYHVYEQLKEELRLHAGKARKYIVLHDTTTFGERGEAPGSRGLWPAVEEFLAQRNFRLLERHTNNHGLTVLESIRPVAHEQGEAIRNGRSSETEVSP